jgi:hypothetical protein
MFRIDDILIAKVASPAVGWLEHKLGINQWRASMEALNGSVAFYMAAVTFELATAGPQTPAFIVLLRALAWLLILEKVRRIAWRQASSSIGVQTARLREWPFRVALTAMMPLSLCYASQASNLLYSASLVLLTCHLYLKASDTPPPEPSGRLAFNLH